MTPETMLGWADLMQLVEATGLKLNRRVWLAGGALLRAATGEPQTGDLDFWCIDDEAEDEARKVLLAHQAVWSGASHCAEKFWLKGTELQLCKRRYESPEDCIHGFDLSVCKLAWDGQMLHTGALTEHDIESRTLRVHCVNPTTAKRIDKYVDRGFRITIDTVRSALTAEREEDGYGPEDEE